MTDKTYDIRLKRLEARVKRQDDYLNRVLQLLSNFWPDSLPLIVPRFKL